MEVAVATNYSKNVSNKIDKLRNYARNGVKAAALGGKGDDVPFEQAFSNLAHAYLQDKAPGLMDHEIGFQLLDRNAENTKAVGVFAFKVGSLWLYAPMFFLNGDLKGHELLYLKNQDMFVPLKENWINYLVNRKPNILGQNVDRNLSQLGQRQPDFTQLSRSPSKFGSAKPTLKEMVTAVMPALAKTATMNTARALEDMGKQLNLAQFLKEAKLTTIDFLVKSCQHAPQLAEAGIVSSTTLPLSPPVSFGSNFWDVDGDGTDDFKLSNDANSIALLAELGAAQFVAPSSRASMGFAKLSSGFDVGAVMTGFKFLSSAQQSIRMTRGGNLAGAAGQGWAMGETGYFGFKFSNGSGVHYGWGQINIHGTTGGYSVGQGYTLTEAYYNSTPDASIQVGDTGGSPSAVPEIDPASAGSVLSLVVGSLAMLERRRLRRSKAAEGDATVSA
jgi:hypothetical protein